ncbi:MAG TPA: MerR family transcriptional regulator, partial [Solirubrobacterales bacterium]|nr:MerR family transcriptional regulator [Solirubrobacterales bacterium]
IGLLAPSERSKSGYRLYGPGDVGRLREILTYRELGFGLEEIAALLDRPDADPIEHLARRRELVIRRIERLDALVDAIDEEMEAQRMGLKLTAEEKLEVFGGFDQDEHAAEAAERWGETEAHRTSQRRVASYTKADWQRIRAETEDVEARFAAAMAAGEASASPTAIDLAEAHRALISRWFYDCPPAMHAQVTRLYVDDPRFAEHCERRAAGLAAYVHEAAVANAARA